MKTKKYLYAKWLDNRATPEEEEFLRQNGDLEWLEKLKSETNTWSLPEVPSMYDTITTKYNKRSSFNYFFEYYNREIVAIAAVLLLFFGVGFLYLLYQTPYENISTAAGEVKSVMLPDKTLITLKENSSISYLSSDEFNKNRIVNLKGNALFAVQTKGSFEVTFELGKVQVLGTKFEINETKEKFNVACTEGKVKVTPKNGENFAVIELGEKVSFQESDKSLEKTDLAKNPEVVFNDEQLANIISFITKAYGIEVKYDGKLDLKRKFTGEIPSDDLISAMNVLSKVMKINYSIIEGPKTVLNIYP